MSLLRSTLLRTACFLLSPSLMPLITSVCESRSVSFHFVIMSLAEGGNAKIEKCFGTQLLKYPFYTDYIPLILFYLFTSLMLYPAYPLPSHVHTISAVVGGAQSEMRLWWASLNEN